MEIEIGDIVVDNEIEIGGVELDVVPEKDHSKLINRDLADQHPISAITGLTEALANSGKIEDVKVNNVTVVSNKVANIELKTIDSQSITGSGDIALEYVKYTANQNLTAQQKANARNNIEALGTEDIKQSTGQSTTDVISQKGVTDLLAEKQDNKPNGVNPLIASDTGKLNLIYIPSSILGGLTYGGTFNDSGIINASIYATELQGEKIDELQLELYPKFYFICSAPYTFAGYTFAIGDWALSQGNNWGKLNSTDAVQSVNGKMGQVVLNYTDVGATKSSWGIDNANKNLVTDASGNVTTSNYALGQIIVDYYEELPTNVPETAKASVINSSSEFNSYDYETLYDSYDQGTILDKLVLNETITRPNAETAYIGIVLENGAYADIVYELSVGVNDEVISVGYTDEIGDFAAYVYSFTQQPFSDDTSFTLQVGWNKILSDPETGDYIVTSIQYSEVPQFSDVTISYMEEELDSNFVSDLGYPIYHLAGEYIYTEIEPSTTPKTYYWKYNPTNVQSDMSENDPLSLAYIKNRAILNTTSSSPLIGGSETITGTINLHKISKTGRYSDLDSPIGKASGNGEIFNSYSGSFKNEAMGNYSHAHGYFAKANGDYSTASRLLYNGYWLKKYS